MRNRQGGRDRGIPGVHVAYREPGDGEVGVLAYGLRTRPCAAAGRVDLDLVNRDTAVGEVDLDITRVDRREVIDECLQQGVAVVGPAENSGVLGAIVGSVAAGIGVLGAGDRDGVGSWRAIAVYAKPVAAEIERVDQAHLAEIDFQPAGRAGGNPRRRIAVVAIVDAGGIVQRGVTREHARHHGHRGAIDHRGQVLRIGVGPDQLPRPR